MGSRRLPAALLVFVLLIFSISSGSGRELPETLANSEDSAAVFSQMKWRKMQENNMDYDETGPNYDYKGGLPFPPPQP